jgi:hypothetical protein
MDKWLYNPALNPAQKTEANCGCTINSRFNGQISSTLHPYSAVDMSGLPRNNLVDMSYVSMYFVSRTANIPSMWYIGRSIANYS